MRQFEALTLICPRSIVRISRVLEHLITRDLLQTLASSNRVNVNRVFRSGARSDCMGLAGVVLLSEEKTICPQTSLTKAKAKKRQQRQNRCLWMLRPTLQSGPRSSQSRN